MNIVGLIDAAILANRVLAKSATEQKEVETCSANADILTKCKEEITKLRDMVRDLGGRP